MCRPGYGSRKEACPGGHIGPPLRNDWRYSGSTGNRCETEPFQRGGTEPAPYRRVEADQRRGEVTLPYGCNAGGAQQRADVPKAWLPPAKFRAEIWGVSHRHRPLRPAGDGTPGSSCPTDGCGEPPRLPRSAAHSGASAPRSRGMGGSRSRDHPQRGYQPRTIPQSRRSRDSSLCTREPRDGGCGLPRRPVGPPRNDNGFLSFRGAERRGNPFLFTMYDGRGFGPPRSSAPTEDLPKFQQRADVGIGPYGTKWEPPRLPGQRLAKRKARKE